MFPTIAVVLVSLLCVQPQEKGSVLFPPRMFLVHAKAVEVKDLPNDRGGGEIGVFTIDRVYVGSDALKGKQFQVVVFRTGGFFGGYATMERKRGLHKGEEGIWWIAEDPADKTLTDLSFAKVVPPPGRWDWHAPAFPYRDPKRFPRHPEITDADWTAGMAVENAYYQSGVRWAEAIETVYRAKSEAERMDLLKKYAVAKNSPAAAWAIYALGKIKPADLKRFLLGLTENAELSVWSQTTLDKELCRLEGREWQRSPRRLKMLQRWVKRKIPDPDRYAHGTSRIIYALRDGELDSTTFVRVFKVGMEGMDKLTKKQKSAFTALLKRINPFEAGDKRLLFDYLTELLQSPDAEVRKCAASGLYLTAPFDRRQLDTLRKLSEASRDAEVKRMLDRAPYGPPTPAPLSDRRESAPSSPSSKPKPNVKR